MDVLFESIDDGSLTNINDFYMRLKSVVTDDLYESIVQKNKNGENALDIAIRLRNKYFYDTFTLKHIDSLDLYELYENIVHLFGEIIYAYQKNCKIVKL